MAFRFPKTKEPHPDQGAFYLLLLTVTPVLAPHVGRVPAWLSLAVATFIVWRYLITRHGWHAPPMWLRTGLTFLIAFGVVTHYGTILGRDAGVGLLFALLGLKFLELRRVRDHVVVLLMCYLLILGQLLYSQSLASGGYMVALTLLTTAAMVRLQHPGRIDGWQGLRFAGGLIAKALPLMLIVYLFFPRLQGGLWAFTADTAGATGFSDVLRPGSINQLVENDAVAFRVRFDGAVPPPEQRYWRGLTLATTDGKVWRRGVDVAQGWRLSGAGPALGYTVTLEPNHRVWLFTLDLPIEVDPPATPRTGYVIQRAKPVHERTRYRAVSITRYNTGPLAADARAHNLHLPGAVSPRVASLAARWQSAARTPQDIVQSALGYFREQEFYYTLQPPLLGRDPVDEFLFDTRRGFCEHYASAFATLMRAAGVPSRVVLGYQGGELNPAGDYMIVRQADAHAWAEVWLAGQGWRRVDPTGAVAPERIEHGIDGVRRLLRRGVRLGDGDARRIELGWLEQAWRQARLSWDLVNHNWNQAVMAFGPEAQEALMRVLGFRAPSWVHLAIVMAFAALLMGLLVAGLVLYQPRARDPVRALYARYCAKLARIGLRRNPAEGPRDFAQRAVAARPNLSDQVERITEIYIGLRYGGDDAGRLRELRENVRAFRPS